MSINTLKDYKEKAMQNPELLKEYNKLEPQYALIRELIRYRVEHEITQEELARRTGLTKSNISRFENGKHSPTLKMISRIAAGLEKSIKISLV